MQSLDDDIEELYRRAGEDYPLNTDSADWQKVQQLLYAEDSSTQGKKKRDYRFFWLLLLLPFAFICGRYTVDSPAVPSTAVVEQRTADHASTTAAINNKKLPGSGIGSKESRDEVDRQSYVPTARDNKNRRLTNAPGSPYHNVNGRVISRTENEISLKGDDLTGNEITGANQSKSKEEIIEDATETGSIPQQALTGNLKDEQEKGQVIIVEKPAVEPIITKANDSSKTSPALPGQRATMVKGKTTKAKKNDQVKRGIYYAFLVAPDVSTVKFKQPDQLGYSAGIVIGYKASKRVRFEAGVLWSTKNYYADGEYIDTSKLRMPPHSKVLSATGSCNMFEIPIAVQYDVYSGAKHSVFVAASLHSYLMKNEGYNIQYKRYNMSYSADYTYTNSTNNWFAVAGLSAGYRTSLGKRGSISFAPYIKLPLRGLGVGRLPISSTGINITVANLLR